RDPKAACRSLVRSRFASEPVAGSRNHVPSHHVLVIDGVERLGRHVNVDPHGALIANGQGLSTRQHTRKKAVPKWTGGVWSAPLFYARKTARRHCRCYRSRWN